MRPDGPRDDFAGPNAGPEAPFPIRMSGPVIKGFGRGSKELGIPTANIPAETLSEYPDLQQGVYYGVATLDPSQFKHTRTEHDEADQPAAKSGTDIFPCVLSIGYNPFYKNTVRSVEIHILPHLSMESSPSSADTDTSGQRPLFHHFPDFYGTALNLLILGYIRPEYDYVSREALIDDIRIDCDVARRSLKRKAYALFLNDDDSSDEKANEARKWLREF
ncbi:riboflavin kinase [Nannizzia gypsea CBS 118893]|uniref:Riboflavin kinase n=1 Tax=Arthroderma gypseum (strain ATCC MYA-4604 / CBS 118893) TaxID=535722 RepID=E4UP60_ARTGP|nr:riboflavin kinase [Nannizzia gypsea CBS 118893]EFQ99002.1 riboflavin kinase [Nannizzia gypsea CBS 118893]